jgi:hypothetical protein
MKNYYISQEQLEQLEHYTTMFNVNCDNLKTLCSSEKDDIIYGFELGQMYHHLKSCFIDMMELTDEIKQQTITKS